MNMLKGLGTLALGALLAYGGFHYTEPTYLACQPNKTAWSVDCYRGDQLVKRSVSVGAGPVNDLRLVKRKLEAQGHDPSEVGITCTFKWGIATRCFIAYG